MADWTANAGHSYEYWRVDPASWRDKEPLGLVTSCSITRDDSDVRGSADLEVGGDVSSEFYVREYLVVEQPPGSGITERFCLGTHLVQTPTLEYTAGRVKRKLTAYSPLLELQDTRPPIGYTSAAGTNVVSQARWICRTHGRLPVVAPSASGAITEPLVAADDDTWLTYMSALLAKAGLTYMLDPYGRISFAPEPGPLLSPVWTYTDDNSSILMPDVTEEYDWFGIPNVYEAVLSKNDTCVAGSYENDSPASPLSTASRGRRVVERDTSPDVPDTATAADLANYAAKKLRELSVVERTVEYSHGYNGVNWGDGVTLDYTRHGLRAQGRVVKQVIDCDTRCLVEETASYTESLWGVAS